MLDLGYTKIPCAITRSIQEGSKASCMFFDMLMGVALTAICEKFVREMSDELPRNATDILMRKMVRLIA